MNSKARTIDEYLAPLPNDKRAALEKLRRDIKAAAPSAEEYISYQVPAFRLNGTLLVAFGAAAKHCAFYPGALPVNALRKELEAYATSKGTIRFSAARPLPATLVRKIVRLRVAERSVKSKDQQTRASMKKKKPSKTKRAVAKRPPAKRPPAKRAAAKGGSAKRAAAKSRSSKSTRSSPPSHVPTEGLYGWITHTDISSTNPQATKEWCAKVLGWTFRPSFPMPSGEYHLFAYSDKGGGGVRSITPPEEPRSIPYIHVADAQAAFDAALREGAEAISPPTRIMEGVTTAVVRAPGGVTIGLSGP